MHRRSFLALCSALPLVRPAGAADDPLKVRDLYAKGGDLSDFATANEGERLTIEGYMAPPLKADSTFFVLTKLPMSVCPFCETEAEWPSDIVAVYTKRVYDVVSFSRRILVDGRLSLGSYRDPETGFLSLVRLEDADFRVA